MISHFFLKELDEFLDKQFRSWWSKKFVAKKERGMLLMRQGLRRSREMDVSKKVVPKPKANVRQCKLESQTSNASSKPTL